MFLVEGGYGIRRAALGSGRGASDGGLAGASSAVRDWECDCDS